MKIIGFKNVVTKAGNKAVVVCVADEWEDWENGYGVNAWTEYVSKIHLNEKDIGRDVVFKYGIYNDKVYVKDMIFLNDIKG